MSCCSQATPQPAPRPSRPAPPGTRSSRLVRPFTVVPWLEGERPTSAWTLPAPPRKRGSSAASSRPGCVRRCPPVGRRSAPAPDRRTSPAARPRWGCRRCRQAGSPPGNPATRARLLSVVEREHAVAEVVQQRRERVPVVGHVLERAVDEDDRIRVGRGRAAARVVGSGRGTVRRGRARRRQPPRSNTPPAAPPAPRPGRSSSYTRNHGHQRSNPHRRSPPCNTAGRCFMVRDAAPARGGRRGI